MGWALSPTTGAIIIERKKKFRQTHTGVRKQYGDRGRDWRDVSTSQAEDC